MAGRRTVGRRTVLGGGTPFRPLASPSALNQLQLLPNLPKRRQCLIEIIPAVGRRDLTTNPGLPLRHHRVAEPGHENTLGQQELAHPDRRGSFSQDDWNDGGLTRQGLESQLE